MAHWQRHLDVKEEWQKLSDDEMSIREFAKVVVTKLTAIKQQGSVGRKELDEELDDLISEFETMQNADDEPRISEFDELWSRLYDWADSKLDRRWNGKKVCWVAIF